MGLLSRTVDLAIDIEYSRYAVQKLLSKLLSGDAIISCRRHGAPKGFPPTTLIRLYELLKNDSRSKDRTGKRSKIACLSVRDSGGGERDRTDDPLLAKQVLSQLSYTPDRRWWVWLDSNQRPPPYQDGALTD